MSAGSEFCTLGPVKTRSFFLFSAVSVSLSFAACSKKEEPPAPVAPVAVPSAPPPPSVTPAAAPAPAPAAEAPLGIEWTDPADWKREAPKSMMRKAQFAIPAAAGDTEGAELTVFYFGPNQGGGVEDNINRWTGQFKDLKKEAIQRSERSVNDLTQHVVEVESGTYAGTSMGPHAPPAEAKEAQGLLGAVVEAPTGKYFFKLSGPTKTVKAARESFFKLLDSIKAKSG